MNRSDSLVALDDMLSSVRRLLQRPGYRARFFEALGASVPPRVLRLLRAVERAGPGEQGLGAVAATLVVDISTASRVADEAERAGLLRRERDPADGRRTVLALTGSARALLERADRVRIALLDEVTAGWQTTDLRDLALALERLLHDLDTLEGAG